MKKISLGAIATVVFSTTAFAADLPARTYTKVPAIVSPASDWSGFYIGGDLGGAWAHTTSTQNPLPSSVAFGLDPQTFSYGGSSFLGAVHLGYNWQVSPRFLVGIEGDLAWLRADGSASGIWTDGGVTTCVPVASCATTMSMSVTALASIRGRAGVLVTPTMLLYGTGGAAWGKQTYNADGFNRNIGYDAPASVSATTSGFVAGGGLEAMFTGTWLLRAEYLYSRFGNGPNVSVFPQPPFGQNYTWGNTSVNTASIGLSYRFGGTVVAQY